MILNIIFSSLTCFFSFLLGYCILSKEKTSKMKQIFTTMTLFLSFWAFVSVFMYLSEEKDNYIFWFKLGYVFQMLYLAAFLHFSFTITGNIPKRRFILNIIYIPCVIAAATIVFENGIWDTLVWVKDMWRFNHRFLNGRFIASLVLWAVYYLTAALLYFRKAGKAAIIQEKKKFSILGFSIFIILGITIVEAAVLPLFFSWPSCGVDMIIKFCWLLCVGILIDRYDFLKAPSSLEEVALTRFPGFIVFLLDSDLRIYKLNREAEILFSAEAKDYLGRPFSTLFPAGEKLTRVLGRLEQDGYGSVSSIVEINGDKSSGFLLDLRISLLLGKSRQPVGYIAVGKKLSGRRELSALFNLSPREIEIIEEIIQGHNNAHIAERLSISEKTVKTHITHIFSKLNVDNRIRLFSLLRKYHYISDHPADRNVIIINSPS